jgi:indole-3-glycerol phosphate synthase
MGDAVAVAESGIAGHHDARDLAAAGFDALLVGEHLVTASNRTQQLKELLHGERTL